MHQKGLNSLFIGKEYLTLEGRDIKHFALIKNFGMLTPKKTLDEPMEFIGTDLETDHITGELKLLGFWEDGQYSYFKKDFLSVLFGYVKKSIFDGRRLVWWNRLDPFIILKQFLLVHDGDDYTIQRALSHYGKIAGEWNKKELNWRVKPVISVNVNGTEFGILNAVRSSIQFYIKIEDEIYKCWAYDVAQMYQNGLEKEATSRFDYYSKVDKSAHLVDWERFESDADFRNNIVLKSNMLDARACHDLALETLKQFKSAFKCYPKTLISQGSLARSALMAQLNNMGLDAPKEARKIGLYHHLDSIISQLGASDGKDFLSLVTEAYSAGYIEAIRFGYAEKGAHADIASAYPATIVKLYDLTDAKYTKGKGVPERAKKGYTFIRGRVNMPKNVVFNPITVKHPVFTSTNIRASGNYIASYTIDERDFMITQGASFSEETWVKIETKGNLSPLAMVAREFIKLRKELLEIGDSGQYMAKIASNSLYGILFEAVDQYEETITNVEYEEVIEDSFYKDTLKQYRKRIDFDLVKKDLKFYFDKDYAKMRAMWHGKNGAHPADVKAQLENEGVYLKSDHPADIIYELNELYRKDTKITKKVRENVEKVVKSGYRAGEFFNPIFATEITAQTRILLAKGALEIERNGGKVIALMTDSITWKGTPEMMPEALWKAEKTLGYFEKPDIVTDIVCLGAGRYGFRTDNGYQVTKQRGLNLLEGVNWLDVIKEAQTNKIRMKTRSLVSVGLVLGNHEFNFKDLGRIVETTRDVDLVVGLTKRPLKRDLNIKDLKNGLMETEAFDIPKGMLGSNDLTLPELRSKIKERPYMLKIDRRRKTVRNAQKRYYDSNIEKERQRKKEYMRAKRGGIA